MNIIVRLRCVEAPDLRDDYSVEINDGATVNEALEVFYKTYDIAPMSYEELVEAAYLVNSTAASKGSALNDGDRVTVIRMLEGG
jgi:sulfur carrier protein ThiS